MPFYEFRFRRVEDISTSETQEATAIVEAPSRELAETIVDYDRDDGDLEARLDWTTVRTRHYNSEVVEDMHVSESPRETQPVPTPDVDYRDHIENLVSDGWVDGGAVGDRQSIISFLANMPEYDNTEV